MNDRLNHEAHNTHTSEPNLIDAVHSDDYKSEVVRGKGYNHPGEVACTDTGNGFIAFFPRHTSAQQDYFVCMDYSQARDLVLALSHFQRALGFNAEVKGDTK